eukprot:1300488-Amphidinium_carterae.1
MRCVHLWVAQDALLQVDPLQCHPSHAFERYGVWNEHHEIVGGFLMCAKCGCYAIKGGSLQTSVSGH